MNRLIANLPATGATIIIPVREHDWSDCFGVNKFGRNPDIDSGTVEDIWSYGGTRTYSSSAVTLNFSSSNAGDTQDVEIQGLDANGDRQTVTYTLAGQTETEISGYTWTEVFRAKNADSSDFAGDVYIYEDDTVSAGVPQTATKVRIKIDAGKQQTHMAHYRIPSGYTGYLLKWYASLNRGNQSGAADVELFTRSSGGVFLSKDIRGLMAGGTSLKTVTYQIAPSYAALTDLKIVADVTGNDNDISAGFDLLCVKNKN